MKQPKHTPGPWTYSLLQTSEHNPIIHCGTEPDGRSSMNLEAIMYRRDYEMEANFKLIAAAPEMLEALELILKIEGPSLSETSHFKLLDAIAKARGES